MAETNETITAAMPAFIAKAIDIKNKHLRRYSVNLIDNLELFQSTYFIEYNLRSIALIVRFPKQVCAIGK